MINLKKIALEDEINRWIKEINDVLVENGDIEDEQWFKTLHTSLILMTKALKHLESKNE